MNKRQKQVIEKQLNDEKDIFKQINKVYKQAINDIGEKIKALQADELIQSKIYQIEHQKALKKQIETILDSMNDKNYSNISDYLKNCYDTGFLGTMYDIAGQGIPLVVPISPEQVTKAVMLESKISEGLYSKMGKDTNVLKRQITAEISRGMATSMPYGDIARNLNNVANIGMNKSKRIAITEGHRITQAATYDAQIAATEKGADVVKQWCSTLDGVTRETHMMLDGQIKEIDEPFEIEGKKAMYPGGFGDPAEDCNCRCCVLQRARWALGKDELAELEERAEYFGLDKTENFNEYREKYLSVVNAGSSDIIKPANAKEEIEVHSVGKIDKDIYKCVTEDIVTDEVIITDERIDHIMERHPNDYERYYEYLKRSVEEPDYIIESHKPNTALILKEIADTDGEIFKTILRLTTSVDNPDFKNSIITFMKINKKEWDRLLRNKVILYKKE